ncbi:Negative elongation factor B [Taenia crassiceps]|uniref:Negative elongation factor B n=1 Tax=Taenia crassiceps TaxID=6207 RepID=A0ABR4Q5L1_9CEST
MKKSIEELFMNGTTSKEDIERFQEKYWEQMVPNFSQALKILDLHDVSRHSVLWNINDRLLEAVKSRIQAKAAEGGDDKKHQKLWQKLIRTGMAYIHHPYMRSAIMMVLGQMNSIKSRYVSLIVDNDYLYKDAPLPVLRHIWMTNQNKFKEEIMKVLHAYQNAMSEALLDPLLASVTSANVDTLPILYWPQRRRRKDPSLMKIVEMIGENENLYEKALEILREESVRYQQLIEKSATRRTASTSECAKKFVDSKTSKGCSQKKEESVTPHHIFIPPALLPAPQSLAAALLCTLRFDLLMCFNEAKLDRICVADPIHHFVWCMDACIKSKRIDRRHASELAVHLNRHHRQHSNHLSLSSEIGLDQDTSEDWVPDLDERGIRKKSMKTPRAGEKHGLDDVEVDSDEGLSKSDHGASAFERDIQIVCRDPWVVYTVCSSLLRVVITGLYEDKSPKSISEVPFLVHLLMRGLESDLCPPELVVNKEMSKLEPKNKRSRKYMVHDDSAAPSPQQKLCPATILITQVLPAAAQLHLTTWRGQVCEEIRSIANRIWSKSSGGGSDSSHLRPTTWQKRLDAVQPTNVAISPAYLAHPVGHLFLQYHALFALERREWMVLRALLKAAAGAAQARPSKSPRLSKSVSSLTPASANQLTIGFRWRPECLQAISLGIASLPVSSEDPTAGDGAPVPTTPTMSEGGSSSGFMSEKSSVGATDSASSATGATSPLSSAAVVSTATNTSTSIVTRAELASLLRTSLPLQSDLQLLVLAQCAKLVPATPSNPTTPGSTGSVTPMPNFFSATELTVSTNVAPRGSSERERLLNALSRHVEYPSQESSTGAGEDNSVTSPPLTPTGFKSSNAKVVEALETLRRELERSTSAGTVPIMGTLKPSSGMLATPLSPLSGGGTMSQQQCGMASPSRLMPPPMRFAPRSGGARCGSGMNAFPMATPLTNPGLSMPPPPPPLAPPLGRLLPSPPLAEYRPPSPSAGVSSAVVGNSSTCSSYPTYATPMVTDMGEGGCGLGSYSVSLSPTGDLRRYAAPVESNSPTPPQPPASP